MYSKIPMIRQHCLHVYFFFGCDEQLLNKLKWDRLFDIGGPSSIQRRQPDLSSQRRELIRILNRMVCPALPCPCWVAINSNICTFSPSASSCPPSISGAEHRLTRILFHLFMCVFLNFNICMTIIQILQNK